MAEYFPIYHYTNMLLNIFLIFLWLVTAGIVFFRFRSSPSGIVVGGVFACFSIVTVLSMIVYSVMARIGVGGGGYMATQAILGLLDFVLTVLLAVGLGLIPKSIAKLASGG